MSIQLDVKLLSSHYHLSSRRNKKGLALDIKSAAEGRAVLRRLPATADVLVESFRIRGHFAPPILDITGAVAHPRHRNMSRSQPPPLPQLQDPRLSREAGGRARQPLAPPPELGEDPDGILTEPGYSAEERRDLIGSEIAFALEEES